MATKLRMHKVTRDAQGNETARRPVAKMAVITDLDQELSEIIAIDLLEVIAIYFNKVDLVFKVDFILGGEDSTGKFHIYRELPDAGFRVNRGDSLWAVLDLDNRDVFDFNTIKQFVHERGGVHRFAVDVWKDATIESSIETS